MQFIQFTRMHPTCMKVRNNMDARIIFDTIIWNEGNRIRMAEFSDLGIPALAAIVAEIESYYDNKPGCTIDLHDDFTKQIIGRMIASSLEPLGYLPYKKKRIPAEYKRSYFSNAMTYQLAGEPTEVIEKRIVQCNKQS